MAINLEDYIATVPDFPKEGILFRDITPMVEDGEALREVTRLLADYAKKVHADVIAGPESRGFVFGVPVAYELGLGFIMIRKPGKLPRETYSASYDLEYGSNELHMNKDAVKPGQRVLIIDDLLATGGTGKASAELVEKAGGVVAGEAFIIELDGLPGRTALKDYDVYTILKMPDSAE